MSRLTFQRIRSARGVGPLSCVAALVSLAVASPAVADQGPACRETGAALVVKDGLYGMGAGFLVSGLALVVTQYPENVLPPLALGGLVGLGVGMGVGALEWASRDCASGFSFRPSFSGQAYGQSENHSTESFRWRTFRLAPAVEFTYRY